MSESIRSYQDLLVWKKGMLLTDEIDRIVDQFDSYRRWWIGLQMHRAVLSITSNIAEGHDSDYTRVYLRNLSDAKGSAREVESDILVIRRRKYLPQSETDVALSLIDEIGRMLRSLSYEVRASTRTRKGDR